VELEQALRELCRSLQSHPAGMDQATD